jgi:predicted GTPase
MKIPRWLKAYTGKKIEFEINAGPYVDRDLTKFKLLVSCGACMINRQEMLRRVEDAGKLSVPITNYGILISYVHGVLDRVLKPYGVKWKYPKDSKFYGKKMKK